MAQHIKLLLAMSVYITELWFWGLAVPVPIQLVAVMPEKAAPKCPRSWAPAIHAGDVGAALGS